MGLTKTENLINSLVTKMTSLEAKLDAIQDGSDPAITQIDQTTDGTTNRVVAKISQTAGENLVQLSGSIPEYGWVDGDIEPTSIGFAFGAKIDPATGSITSMYWNGTAWVEVG